MRFFLSGHLYFIFVLFHVDHMKPSLMLEDGLVNQYGEAIVSSAVASCQQCLGYML